MVRLLLLAALVVLASGASLSYSVHQFTSRDVRGTFSLLFRLPGCPQKVFHTGAINNGATVLHGGIQVSGTSCQNNGQMDLFPITDTAKVDAALANFNNTSKTLAMALIDNAKKVPGSVVGTSGVDRVCGATTIAKNAIFVFVSTNQSFTISQGFQIQANRRGMVYIAPGSSTYCTYDAKPVPSPTPSPSPSAVPANETLPATAPTEAPDVNETQTSPPPASLDNATDTTTVPGTSPDTTAAPAPGVADITEAEPTASPESDGRICFPGSATVELEDGSVKKMTQLEIGDRVRVGVNTFSDVFMFTHKLSSVSHKFVRLSTESGHSLSLTRGHYLNVNGVLKAAKAVKLGDVLTLGNGMTSTVTHVSVFHDEGLYNPQTVQGSIIVNDVLASTYTTTVEMGTAHSMLSPVRFAYNFFGLAMTALESGADSIAAMLPQGSAVC